MDYSDDMSEKFEKLIADIGDSFDKIGLYMTVAKVNILADDEIIELFNSDKISEDDAISMGANLILAADFNIGSVAFSDRVQDPDSFNLKNEFDKIAPLEEEITLFEINEFLNEEWDE